MNVLKGASNPADPSLCCNPFTNDAGWTSRLVLAQTLATDGDPAQLASGDFNGDGWPDLAVIIGRDPDISVAIFMNQQGVFQPAQAFAVGAGTAGIAAADMNGDGWADLIVGDVNGQTLTVRFSNGDGSFAFSNSYPAGWAGRGAPQVADFNGDGIPDVVSGSGPLLYFQGKPGGALSDSAAYNDEPNYWQRFVIGDFTGDYIPDLVSAALMGSSGFVRVLIGQGNGSFDYYNRQAVDLSPYLLTDLVAGDLDGNGYQDLAIATLANPGNGHALGYLPNLGDWSFGALQLFMLPNAAGDAAGLAVTDLDGDGRSDLLFALPTFTPGDPSFFWGVYQLDVATGAVQAVLPRGSALWPLVSDVNRDGAPDVIGIGDPTDPLVPSPGLAVYLNGCP